MDTVLLHSTTRLHLDGLRQNPPHALLFVAPTGTGKRTIAREWGKQLSPHIETIEPDDKGTISIEAIRSLYRRTRSKQTGQQVVLIDHAEAMGAEAQNALLKLLEEPRDGVTFILTCPTLDSLLPTITSRVQAVHIQPVLDNTLRQWLASKQQPLDAQSLAQLLFVAAGRPGTLARLLEDPGAFAHHKELMLTAKQLVAAQPYERLAMIPAISKDRTDLTTVLEAMAHMVKLQISRNPEQKWFRLAEGLQTCLARLAQNGNPRAQLTQLFMIY